MRFIVFLLVGCTVDLGDAPAAPPECRPPLAAFQQPGGIWDVAIDPADQTHSCIAQGGCHSQSTGRSALRLVAKPRDLLTDADWRGNYEVIARFLNCGTPAASPLITKPEAGVDPHLGGDLWACDETCEPIRAVEAWIGSR